MEALILINRSDLAQEKHSDLKDCWCLGGVFKEFLMVKVQISSLTTPTTITTAGKLK